MKKHIFAYLLSIVVLASFNGCRLSPSTSKTNDSSSGCITEGGRTAQVSNVVVGQEMLIHPTGASVDQYEPGYEIEKAFDGDRYENNYFHSPWYDKTQLPVIMEFFFDGNGELPEQIESITYYTRAGNGNFGEFNLYVSTETQEEYVLYGQYDFRMVDTPSTIELKGGLKRVRKIKFEVLSGLGGYASCAEMEFHGSVKRDEMLEKKLLEVFTDLSCSELKPSVTQSQIHSLPDYFSILADKLQKKNYASDFRIHDYPAYSDPAIWAEKLLTNKYGRLDNITGIYANAGEEVLVLVGDTHGHPVSLMSMEDSYPYGYSYVLRPGINKLKMVRRGMLYVMYHTDLSDPTARPIRVHIPMGCGTVNGYFDLEKHHTDAKYADLLKNSTWKYFTVKGRNVMMTLHASRLKKIIPDKIRPTLKIWDDIIDWDFELMGLEDIRPKQMNNRLYVLSNEEGYMSANEYFTQFHENTIYKIMDPAVMLTDRDHMWGPAHEIGHVNQGAINWKGCQESTNNLFSNYVTYKLRQFASRGSALTELNKLRIQDNTPYVLFEPQWQNENMEMHTRLHWQLFTYFHRMGIQPRFYPDLFKRMRANRCPVDDPGGAQLNYVKQVCATAHMDLTDYFEFWGFFIPLNYEIEQYGTWHYVVTREAIDETKQWIKKQNYPKPPHIIQYVEDRHQNDRGNIDAVGDVGKWTQFRDNQKITKRITYSKQGDQIQIKNGEEAVAFEVREGNRLCYFSNFLQFTLPSGLWKENMKLFAVQTDGKRIPLVSTL